MYHLFSWDPIVDLFTNIKCLQANPFAVRFAAYCSRSTTDARCVGKRQGEEADERLGEGPIPWFLWECVAFLLLTAKQHVVTDCLKSLISGDCITCQTVGMLFLFRCTVLLLLLLFLLLFCRCLVGFLEREIQKRDIHKTDNHPHPLFIVTFKKKLELRVAWRQAVEQAPAQS